MKSPLQALGLSFAAYDIRTSYDRFMDVSIKLTEV